MCGLHANVFDLLGHSQWERKALAQALKYNLDDAAREQLYAQWGVHTGSKERKLQLAHKVVIRGSREGLQACAQAKSCMRAYSTWQRAVFAC